MNNKNCKKANMNKRRGKSGNYKSEPKPKYGNEGEKGTEHKYNDVSWYTKNEAMLRDCASFSYNSPLGNPIPWNQIIGMGAGNTLQYQEPMAVPGMMSLQYVPTIGVSKDSASPANLAAQNIYSYVRYMNSGAKNYDQADIMLYLLAMDSIYMMWNWAKRIYGYARSYSQYNKYMPKMYAVADNVNLDSVIGNMADFRYRLNSLAAQISSFCVPAVMPLFVRHSWMASNIYMDSANQKAQQYMFTPSVYYTYNETASQYGGKLVASSTKSGDPLTYDGVCAIIKSMLDAVAYSEDIGVMSGDILKAYGQDRLFKLTTVDEDYTVLPVYNEEVLNQIHNSTVYDYGTDISVLDISQNPNTGYLMWNPQMPTQRVNNMGAFINMPWDNVTPANTMVGTRLTAMVNVLKPSSGDPYAVFSAIGSEFINKRRITSLSTNGTFMNVTVPASVTFNFASVSPNNIDWLKVLREVSNFDWHPLIPLFAQASTDGTTFNFAGMMGDITNYTIISEYNMQQMHTAAILSEFNVPQLGSF